MIIYADILFAINFVMDYLSLYVCAKVLNFKCRTLRMITASAFGGVYSIAGIFISLPEPLCAFAVSLFMCFISFGKRKISAFIKTVILFYATGMLFGGIMTFLYNVIYKYKNAPLFEGGLKTWMFFALAAIMFLFTLAAGRLFSMFMYRKNVCADITFGTQSKRLNLLCDTGNLLRDPYSDLPVIVLRAQCLDSLLGKDGIHRRPDKVQDDEAVKYKLRYIPVKTAAGNTLMPAVSADKICILQHDGTQTDIQALIASDSISDSSYGGNDGIIPYSLTFNF